MPPTVSRLLPVSRLLESWYIPTTIGIWYHHIHVHQSCALVSECTPARPLDHCPCSLRIAVQKTSNIKDVDFEGYWKDRCSSWNGEIDTPAKNMKQRDQQLYILLSRDWPSNEPAISVYLGKLQATVVQLRCSCSFFDRRPYKAGYGL